MFEGGATPLMARQELHRMGFAGVIEASLASLCAFAAATTATVAHADLLSPALFRRAVAREEWLRIERDRMP